MEKLELNKVKHFFAVVLLTHLTASDNVKAILFNYPIKIVKSVVLSSLRSCFIPLQLS